MSIGIQVENIIKYQEFIDYNPLDSIENTRILLRLLREIYTNKVKSSAEKKILDGFAKKCQFGPQELAYHENTIKGYMGVVKHQHKIPVSLFWDAERLCSIEGSSLFRVWIKNIEQSTFSKISVDFIVDSDDIIVKPPSTERKLDIDQTLCFTSSYMVSADYTGGETAFRIKVIVFDHHGEQWIYHSQDKLILSFSGHKESSIVELKENHSAFAPPKQNYHTKMLNEGIKNALSVPLTLIESISEEDLTLQKMHDKHNFTFNLGLNINSSALLKKVELVSYPFFTMGLAKEGIPLFTDLGIEAITGISRFHLSFCYTAEGLKLQFLNTKESKLNHSKIDNDDWQDVYHDDILSLFGGIELKIKTSIQKEKYKPSFTMKSCTQIMTKLKAVLSLMDDLKKKSESIQKEQLIKLLNKEYSEFLYMQSELKNNDNMLNYIELQHTDNSAIDNIKYFCLFNDISIGSNLMHDNICIPELAPSQMRLSFSKDNYYLTQLGNMHKTTIVRKSGVILLERYHPEVLEVDDLVEIGSDVSLTLYEI